MMRLARNQIKIGFNLKLLHKCEAFLFAHKEQFCKSFLLLLW